jgi:hypothetical protein
MSINYKIKLDNIKKKIKETPKNAIELRVGFLTSEYAEIAKKNEYGGIYPVSPEYRARAKSKGILLGKNISIIPRPFMQQSINNHKQEWKKTLNSLLKKDKPEIALEKLGRLIEANIKDTIVSGVFQENPEHIAQIKGRNKPLIDSGGMLEAVNWEIRR